MLLNYSIYAPFRVAAPSKTRVIHWQTNEGFSLIAAEVQYAGAKTILHSRTVLYLPEARAWLIADRISPDGLDARIHLTFPPGIKTEVIEVPYHGIQLNSTDGKSLWICSMQAEKPQITQSWASSAYGIKQECLQAEFRFSGKPIHYWALLPKEPGNELEARVLMLFKIWEQSQGATCLEE